MAELSLYTTVVGNAAKHRDPNHCSTSRCSSILWVWSPPCASEDMKSCGRRSWRWLLVSPQGRYDARPANRLHRKQHLHGTIDRQPLDFHLPHPRPRSKPPRTSLLVLDCQACLQISQGDCHLVVLPNLPRSSSRGAEYRRRAKSYYSARKQHVAWSKQGDWEHESFEALNDPRSDPTWMRRAPLPLAPTWKIDSSTACTVREQISGPQTTLLEPP
jgi:hypothetical protein